MEQNKSNMRRTVLEC